VHRDGEEREGKEEEEVGALLIVEGVYAKATSMSEWRYDIIYSRSGFVVWVTE